MRIDSKYTTVTNITSENTAVTHIVSDSGNVIPGDEPLFLLRACDRHALSAIQAYKQVCERDGCTPVHMGGINERIAAFESFRNGNPTRMRQPGAKHGNFVGKVETK